MEVLAAISFFSFFHFLYSIGKYLVSFFMVIFSIIQAAQLFTIIVIGFEFFLGDASRSRVSLSLSLSLSFSLTLSFSPAIFLYGESYSAASVARLFLHLLL